MHRNTLTIFTAAVLAVAIAGPSRAAAPQETKKGQAKQEEAAKGTLQSSEKKDETFYRVDYVISELEHGKRVNTRNYTLKSEEGSRSSFRVGNRIAIHTPGTTASFQYENVGVNIDSTAGSANGQLHLHTSLGVNSVADSAGAANHELPPVFRDFRLEDDSLVEPGKPTLIGAIDDAASDRRYEIEVTVTKLK